MFTRNTVGVLGILGSIVLGLTLATSCVSKSMALETKEETTKDILLQFLKAVDASEIVTSDEMYRNGKQKLIDSDLAVYSRQSRCAGLTIAEQSGLWFVEQAGADYIWIQLCANETDRVRLKAYKKSEGYLIENASVTGFNGHSHSFSFYDLSADYQLTKIEGDGNGFSELGLVIPLDNDFLAPEQHFSTEQNRPVQLWAVDNGIRAEPWTWAESRWENRKLIREFWFEWNGDKFVRQQRELKQE